MDEIKRNKLKTEGRTEELVCYAKMQEFVGSFKRSDVTADEKD